jgi:hypothetical protein
LSVMGSWGPLAPTGVGRVVRREGSGRGAV